MEIIARAKYLRMSPRKVRLVADLIRGLDVEKAQEQLAFSKKIAAKPLAKILGAAIGNAAETYDLSKDNLKIKAITVDGGPALKRWMPRAQGRATPIRKDTSHVTMILTEIVASGKAKKVKVDDKSDLVKVATGSFDEIADVSSKKAEQKPAKGTAAKKGFATKVLNRKTGSK